MTASGFALFATSLGPGGIAWGPNGLRGLQFFEADRQATLSRLARRFPDLDEAIPPAPVTQTINLVKSLLETGRADMTGITLDMADVPPFHRRVYALARAIPPGETRTYGDLARDLGDVTLARAVGQALGKNPFPIVMPCHRILAASGGTGGFSARGGVNTKLQLLEIERARTSPEPSLFDWLPFETR